MASLSQRLLTLSLTLSDLFSTLGKVLRDVIQKDADDSAVEERMKKDKNLSELMVMQDTFEIDPTRIDEDEMLNVNSIQLTLLVQQFMKHIFQSVGRMPPEFREVMIELRNSVSSMFPDAVQCAMSAFLFLRFFNCAIAVPESYGLLDEPPNERVRRSLVLATKILTTMTSGAHFGDKEEFMKQFNEVIDKNQSNLSQFYDEVCSDATSSVGESEYVDTPNDIYARSMTVIGWGEKNVKGGSSKDDE